MKVGDVVSLRELNQWKLEKYKNFYKKLVFSNVREKYIDKKYNKMKKDILDKTKVKIVKLP